MRIEEINGQLVNKNSQDAVSLPPGKHSIRVVASHRARSLREQRLDPDYDIINVDVEAGKTYYLAWDSELASLESSIARGLVIHRVDDSTSSETLWSRDDLEPSDTDREYLEARSIGSVFSHASDLAPQPDMQR
ncbi:MAG: hypothetical protein RQ741_08255 [Wenzhouxiangellaceae bacterium]|nr:hypothetical protein [Wenzhouxiangellaceae bacterium]